MKTPHPKQFNVWLTEAERQRLDAVRTKLGLRSNAEAIRHLISNADEKR